MRSNPPAAVMFGPATLGDPNEREKMMMTWLAGIFSAEVRAQDGNTRTQRNPMRSLFACPVRQSSLRRCSAFGTAQLLREVRDAQLPQSRKLGLRRFAGVP